MKKEKNVKNEKSEKNQSKVSNKTPHKPPGFQFATKNKCLTPKNLYNNNNNYKEIYNVFKKEVQRASPKESFSKS